MFKGLANIGGLLKHAQQIGGQLGQMTEEMRRLRVTGSAGGGMVEIEMNGLMETLGCRIDPGLFAQNDRELLEDLLVGAINQAVAKGKQTHADRVREMTGGMQLPGGLQDMLDKFSGDIPGPEDEKG